eukprot:6596649-Pyramimonas_sp.AAC.1
MLRSETQSVVGIFLAMHIGKYDPDLRANAFRILSRALQECGALQLRHIISKMQSSVACFFASP